MINFEADFKEVFKDWGNSATYSGNTFDCKLSHAYFEQNIGSGVSTREPILTLTNTDAADIKKGSSIVVDGVTYEVATRENGERGKVMLRLIK